MADHPLRPATRLRLGGPLPRQLADGPRTHPVVRAPCGRPLSPKIPKSLRPHAVLAVLSNCCPPPQGRLSTCYAPVRRFTQDRSPFLARLACVKPAANVRSEPGSNSPLSSSLTPGNHRLRSFRGSFASNLPLLPLLFSFQRPNKIPGSDLLSHTVSRAVPLALEGLTAEFGMGSGVTPPG